MRGKARSRRKEGIKELERRKRGARRRKREGEE